MVATHELKTCVRFFEQTLDGKKSFEVRRNDRHFQRGDYVILKEWDTDPVFARYTGREIKAEIVYVLTDFAGIEKGFCVLQLNSITPRPHNYAGQKP